MKGEKKRVNGKRWINRFIERDRDSQSKKVIETKRDEESEIDKERGRHRDEESERKKKKEGERDGESEIKRERERDIQTDRQTDRQSRKYGGKIKEVVNRSGRVDSLDLSTRQPGSAPGESSNTVT